MKKLTIENKIVISFGYLLLLTAIFSWVGLLTSCNNTISRPIKLDGYSLRVDTFTYKTHNYMQFSGGNATWGVHDPDCLKCKK